MERLKNKKLLILGGAAIHCKVVETARAMGVYTIVTDYLENSPAKLMADEHWLLNIMDVDEIVSRCKKENVDGVLNFCIDPCQRPYVKICEELGLPCYGTAELVHILTDKPTFKDFCVQNGLDVIPTYSEKDVIDDRCEYPVFVKPTDSRGSRGQAVCYTQAETFSAIEIAKKESSNGEVVIEKFMQGKQDFSMTYFICDGVPYLTRTCDRYLGKLEDGLNKQCIGCIGPSIYTDLYLDMVHEKVKRFIRALGMKNGPFFMQGFIDGDTVRFYDPGMRFPGGEYERLLKEITGVDLMKAMIEFALLGKMSVPKGIAEQPYLLNSYHTIQLPIAARPGKIGQILGMNEIKKDPRVTSAFQRYEAGETVPLAGDVRQRVCEVAMVVGPEDSVRNAIEDVYSNLQILDTDGEDMRVSLVAVEKLNY